MSRGAGRPLAAGVRADRRCQRTSDGFRRCRKQKSSTDPTASLLDVRAKSARSSAISGAKRCLQLWF